MARIPSDIKTTLEFRDWYIKTYGKKPEAKNYNKFLGVEVLPYGEERPKKNRRRASP